MKYEIKTELKKEILDPEARAIHQSLQKKGFKGLKNLAISKSFHLNFEDDTEEALKKVKELTEKHLINPLSENYAIKQIDDTQEKHS